jgi:hypothetical protein
MRRLMAKRPKHLLIATGLAAGCIIGLGLFSVGGFAAVVFIVTAAIKWLGS